MPTKTHHVILRSRIEVTIDKHSQNNILQHILHKVIQRYIIPILSKLFAQYAPHDVVIHLDKLVIDVGSLNLSTLGKQLPRQLEQILMLKLKEQISKVIHNPTAHQVIPLPAAKMQAIAHYLSEGNFAWWMIERSEKQIEKIYLALLHDTPLLIAQLWANLAKKEKAVQRSMILFSRTTLAHTLAYLLQQPIPYFTPILTEMGLLLHQIRILAHGPYTPEQQIVSMALLGIINQPSYKVDRISFLQILLQQVARQTSIRYEKILEKLHTYYAQNDGKYSCNQTIKAWVLQLRDIVLTPPQCWYQDIKHQEKVLKALDKIGNHTMAPYQLSATISAIKAAMDQPGIPALVKSWLKEKKNREKLVKALPDALFISFLASIDPDIITLCSDFVQIATATTANVAPACTIKAITLVHCAFAHSTTTYFKEIKSLFRKYMSNNVINPQRFSILFATQAYHPAVEAAILPLVSIAQASLASDYPKTIMHQDGIIPTDQQLWHTRPTYLDKDHVSVSASTLSDTVDFLLYNTLPKDASVPAYLIAKCLEGATCKQIRDQLAPLCQEAAILRKLMQHATATTLCKLLQAFIPFPGQMLDGLEQLIIQSKVLQSTEQLTHIRLIKEIFIRAAIMHTPPITEKQYIERILCHLSAQISRSPTILCDQLINTAKQTTDYHFVETFTLLKATLAPLNLNKLDDVDLMFLFTHETFALDKACWPLYYSKLLPAIKHMVRQADAADLSRSVIDQLVAQHLPTIAKPLQETIGIALYKQMTNALQDKQAQVAKRWNLFLLTGQLGHYSAVTALLHDVIAHLPTFSLAQHKAHVRQRLIANFTHAQLILLVQKHSATGKALANFIQGSYQLWCATQGSLGEQTITKSLFWDGILKTLPKVSIAKDDWLAQIITELSNVLHIPPTTLLGTFQLLIQDTKGIPAQLTTALNRLQAKHRQGIQQQAIQRGYKASILTKLYLLLNGSLSLFAKQYHLAMPTLGNALIQFIADQPLALSKFLKEQDNHQLVARRIVHYFGQEVTTKIIACLAKDKALFVMHYLALLTNPLQHTTTPLHHLSTWKKELCISILYYLITKSQIEETDFIHCTLLTTCYAKAAMHQIITSIVATRGANQEEDKIITLLQPLIKPTHRMGQSTLATSPLETLPAAIQKAPSQKVSPLAEEIRVYTKNTGLVFLWPFFYDFFKVHNLMVGNQFVCEQAAHNAVHLLQYLVTGKLKSPEWQLTLPKLLCGLSYDAVLLPYRPIHAGYDPDGQEQTAMVDAPEKQPQQASTESIEARGLIANSAMEAIAINSQLLIEKVIKRWKSLTKLKATAPYQNDTTQHILKNYFLNRLGILTRQQVDDATENYFWHLTIMHQDHDTWHLLPPWSMTSLKLPWMQEAIILFWMLE